jgi:excisionase family DNA binding protein
MVPDLLTVEKAAQVMAVSPSYVYKLVRSKQLPAVKIGTSVRLRPSDLEAFIASKLTMMAPDEVLVHVWESQTKKTLGSADKKVKL